MSTTQAPDPHYTLEQAQADIAGLRSQIAAVGQVVSTVSDKALLLYAPGANAIPRGPTSWDFEDGTVQGWSANSGAVTNSTVTATGWPTEGTHSLLLTANGGATPYAGSTGPGNTGLTANAIHTQPGDPVVVHMDIYCPAAQTSIWVAIWFYDDTGTFISNTFSTLTSFSAGQVQTLYVSQTAPDLSYSFGVFFGCNNTLASGQLIYGDNIQVQGNLAISASPGGGTDPVGNQYDSGFEVQVEKQGAFRVRGVSGQVITMYVLNGIPFLFLATGASEEAQAANFQAQVGNPGPSQYLTAITKGPQGNVHTDYTAVALNSAAKDGSFPAGGDLEYITTGGVLQFPLVWGKNGVRVTANGISGDTNTYQTERATVGMVGNNPVTINQTSFSQQILQTLSLGVGLYRIYGQVAVLANQAAGFVELEFSTSGAVATMRIDFEEFAAAADAVNPASLGNRASILGFASAFTGGGFGTNLSRTVIFDGTINVTTAGSLGLFAACGTAATDTWVARGLGSYMTLEPIGP